MIKDDDFGFTIEDDEKLPEIYQKTVYVDSKAQEMYEIVIPFFLKLKDGKGDTIKWPEEKRRTEITKIIEKLREIKYRKQEDKEEMRQLTQDEIIFQKEMGVLKNV